jgi:hypothetical protein
MHPHGDNIHVANPKYKNNSGLTVGIWPIRIAGLTTRKDSRINNSVQWLQL